jgi:lysozyme family protein
MLKEIQHTLFLEGGFSDDKHDAGGATMCGLSLSYMLQAGDRDNDGTLDFDLNRDGKVDAADVKLLTIEAVAEEVKAEFFDRLKLSQVTSLRVRWKILDIAVNMGRGTAAKMVQKIIGVKEDGVIGNDTLHALNTRLITGVGEAAILDKLIEAQIKRYVHIVKANTSQIVFLEGWVNRGFDRGAGLG